MNTLLDPLETTLRRMRRFVPQSINTAGTGLLVKTWWVNARNEALSFLLLPQKEKVLLTDQGETWAILKEHHPPFLKKRKTLFLKSLLTSLEVVQEDTHLVAYSSLLNLENTMFSYTQALITLNGFALIEEM